MREFKVAQILSSIAVKQNFMDSKLKLYATKLTVVSSSCEQGERLWRNVFNPLMLRKSESVVWTYDTFDHNFDIGNGFINYLKESCR